MISVSSMVATVMATTLYLMLYSSYFSALCFYIFIFLLLLVGWGDLIVCFNVWVLFLFLKLHVFIFFVSNSYC